MSSEAPKSPEFILIVSHEALTELIKDIMPTMHEPLATNYASEWADIAIMRFSA